MIGGLGAALTTLLAASLPELFGGAAPAVALAAAAEQLTLDPQSAEATASEPRPDSRTDLLPFDQGAPEGPYTLTQPPYPGPRRVRLVSGNGERIPLRDAEVHWDADDPRVFRLALSPARPLADITGVQVLYGVIAVFTTLKAAQTVRLQLASSDAARLDRAEALAVAVIALNRQHLIDSARASYADGDYRASVEIKTLTLLGGEPAAADRRALTLRAEVELKATRALRADEGRPIERIRTPGMPPDPDRPVDIRIDVDA